MGAPLSFIACPSRARHSFDMEDKEAAKVLESILKKYELSDAEKDALRQAIGVLAWTKLIEGYTENRKKARDRKLRDAGMD